MTTETNSATVEIRDDAEARKQASVWELAQIIANSRDFPECRSPEKAAVRILAGGELGVGPIASVIGIRVQAGRVSIDAALIGGVVKRSGIYNYRIVQHSDDVCELSFTESGEAVGMSIFTIADAKKAGLLKNDTWQKYPRNMLLARALTNGARWYCPALFGGAVYTHEELGYRTDDEGRAIGDDSGTVGGSDLCTREQRTRISALATRTTRTCVQICKDEGIKLLDELSAYEADRLIKKLEKEAARHEAKSAASVEGSATDRKDASSAKDANVAPEAVEGSTAPAIETIAQQDLREAIEESQKPSTPQQRQSILDLADTLEPDEDVCRDMLVAALAKRGKAKLADLDYGQAESLIESLRSAIAEDPPFDPAPGK